MGDDVLSWLVYLTAGGAVGSAAWFFTRLAQTATSPYVESSAMGTPTGSLLLKILRPYARRLGFLIGKTSAWIEMRTGRDSGQSLLLSTRIRVTKHLNAAGRPDGLSADEFLGLMGVSAFIGLMAGMLVYWRVRLGIFPFAGMALFACLPIAWLGQVKRRRQHQMKKLLPYAIDLLSLSVTAGLDFTEALGRIVAKLGRSPLSDELSEMLRQIRLGKSRAEALRELGRRVDLSELHSVVSALVQTDELGGSLGPILRAQANQLRVTRSQAAEKQAMKAPVKILFPLIFFIFPTIFIMIGGPIALKLLTKAP